MYGYMKVSAGALSDQNIAPHSMELELESIVSLRLQLLGSTLGLLQQKYVLSTILSPLSIPTLLVFFVNYGFHFTYMSVLPGCMFVHQVGPYCLWRQEGVRSPGTRATHGCELACRRGEQAQELCKSNKMLVFL